MNQFDLKFQYFKFPKSTMSSLEKYVPREITETRFIQVVVYSIYQN